MKESPLLAAMEQIVVASRSMTTSRVLLIGSADAFSDQQGLVCAWSAWISGAGLRIALILFAAQIQAAEISGLEQGQSLCYWADDGVIL
jgi:hypothetical protein